MNNITSSFIFSNGLFLAALTLLLDTSRDLLQFGCKGTQAYPNTSDALPVSFFVEVSQ